MSWLNELGYTLRILGKNMKFTLLCVSVILIGIAIVLPMYALLDNLALKTPRLGPGDEYVVLNQQRSGAPLGVVAAYDAFQLQRFREQATSFASLHGWRLASATISDGEYAESFPGAELEPALLQRIPVQPLRGRLLAPQDGGEAVALISYDAWRNYYAGREDIVGHRSRISGELRTIVGVMPEGFAFPVNQDVWLPLAIAADAQPGEGSRDLSLIGILADGVSRNEASAEIGLLQSAVVADAAEAYEGVRTSIVLPYTYFNLGFGNTPMWTILAVLASIILLVACNIGNLFVARGEERIQELALRSALGATPARVAQSMLLESFVVCCAGLLVGWMWAAFFLAWMDGLWASTVGEVLEFFWWDLSLNARLMGISALVVALVWLGSGGLPAWRIGRTNLNELLNSGGKGLSEGGSTRVSKILVNIQLVLGCVLLTLSITTLTLVSAEQVTRRPNSDTLFTGLFKVGADMQASAQRRQAYIDTLTAVLLDERGVDGVALTNAPPGGGSGATRTPFEIEDADLRVNDAWPTAHRVFVTDAYFEVIDAALVEGRRFGAEDADGSLPVAIVDRRLADELWPGSSAIGKRIRMNPDDSAARWLTIVGIVEPIIMEGSLGPHETGTPGVYLPLRQALAGSQLRVIVKAAAPGFDYRGVLRRAAAVADRDTPFTDIRSLAEIEQQAASTMLAATAPYYALILLALYLTATATYGLAARIAGRRRTEIGIRMALGASPAASIRLFLKDGFRIMAFGLAIGGFLAITISYVIVAGVAEASNAVGAIVPTALLLGLMMGGLVMLANYLPARKIVAMDPADALRYE